MKKNLEDLNIFGGPQEFETQLHVGRPNIGNRDLISMKINEVLDDRWLTNNGPKVQEFEKRLQDYLGVKHAIAITNGTIALELLIRASGVENEVIVPSFTFVASAHAFQWQGIKPVFCDINPLTHNIDPSEIERHITPKTSAILGVHLWGRPCEIEALKAIADKHNLKLMFDASHAFSCSYKNKRIGNFGVGEVFSFHATKFFNTLEGGAVVTNNDELAEKIRLMKNFGFRGYDNVVYIGTNGKMNEISAAMGLVSFQSIEEFIETNRINYETYSSEFKNIEGLNLITYDKDQNQNFQYVVCELDEDKFGVDRDLLIEILMKENILARRYFYPGVHNMEPYKSYYPYSSKFLPNTEKLSKRIISFPTGTAINTGTITQIADLIAFISKNSKNIKNRLGKS